MTITAALPDGTELQFPDETPQSTIDALAKFHIAKSAGAEPPSQLESFGHGMFQPIAAAKHAYLLATDPQAAAVYTQQLNEDEARYQRGVALRGGGEAKPWYVPEDPSSIAGQATALAPTMAIGGGPVASGLAQGAIAGALTPPTTGTLTEKAWQTGLGGVTGGVLNKLGSTAFQGAQWLRNKLMGAADTLPPEMADRIAAMKAVGIDQPPLPAITRSPQDWYDYHELGKATGAKDAYTAAEQAAHQQLGTVLPNLQANPGATSYQRAEAVRQTVGAYAADARHVASGTYDAAAKAPGADTPFDAQGFLARIQPTLEDYEGQIPTPVLGRIQQFQAGVLADQGEMPAASGAAPRAMTVGEAAKLYKLVNNTMKLNAPSAAAGAQIKSALADVGSQLPGEPGTAMQLFKDATQQWRTQAQALEPGAIAPFAKQGVEGEMSPEALRRIVTTGKPGEISSLVDLAKANTSGDAATAPHDELLDYLQNAGAQANGRWSGFKFGRAVDNVGPERMAAVLSPDELATIQNLRTASDALTVEPNLANVNRSNTGSTVMNWIKKSAPIAGAAAGEAIGEHMGIPLVGTILGAGIGHGAEKFGELGAERQMARMAEPDLQALAARFAPGSMTADMLRRYVSGMPAQAGSAALARQLSAYLAPAAAAP